MDKKQTLEMIAAISNANGAPGFEDEAARLILSYACCSGVSLMKFTAYPETRIVSCG